MEKVYTAPPIEGDFEGKSIVSVDQFDRYLDIEPLFNEANNTKKVVEDLEYKKSQDRQTVVKTGVMLGDIVCSMFLEESSRTKSSFTVGTLQHSGEVYDIYGKYSSMMKGESLQDTILTQDAYSPDLIVLRSSHVGSAAVAASISDVPIINAGDGAGEHPTQAMLDLFTIQERLGKIDGLNVTLLGDLKNGRTVHSLARLLSQYNVNLKYVSPKELAMPQDYINELNEKGIDQESVSDIEPVLKDTDVLYVTRVQGERFLNQDEYHRLKDAFKITPKLMEEAKDNMIVMHPLPRVGEISTDFDSDPRAAYFQQMKDGKYIRMALLALVLGKSIESSIEKH